MPDPARVPRPLALALAAALAISGCELPGAADLLDALQDCSTAGQNRFVEDALQEDYLWYRELPRVDAASFASPEEYLEAVRYRPRDTTFSYIITKAEEEALARSQYVGIGFVGEVVGGNRFVLAQVHAGSPAAEAGLDRGSEILEVGGRSVSSLIAADQLNEAFGPRTAGTVVRLAFRDRAGAFHDVQVTKRTINEPVVPVTRVFAVSGRAVGYVMFSSFVEPGIAALDAAFAQLQAAGVSELILDLRYNGGGRLDVSRHLAGLIGGSRTRGKVFVRLVHNDKNRSSDESYDFPNPDRSLGLERLVVITTRRSASASELIVSGLRPHMTVVEVGATTYGKPVGQEPRQFCEKVLYPVTFEVRNALDSGDYYDGIPPDCGAVDDFGRALGDPDEASLAAALAYVRDGTCGQAGLLSARRQRSQPPPRPYGPRDGVGIVTGAY